VYDVSSKVMPPEWRHEDEIVRDPRLRLLDVVPR
jgi:hypothetical protein